ncbi:transglycosylase family protein [Streptomyces odonnellii]|uniref:transglycosylase family protein n=1 Tax=Streptomyces odonnellii TaxID=1417980 RepID=UPI000698FEE4
MSNAQGSHRAARGGRRGARGRRDTTQEPQQSRTPEGHRRLLPKALPRVLPKALVVAFLAGGTSAFAGDMAELSADGEVAVGTHDIVAPAPGAALVTAMRAEGAHLSASRSSVRRDGLTRDGLTRDGLTRDGLTQDGLTRDSLRRDPAGDRVSEEAIPYDTVRTEDPSVFRGTEIVDQQGSPGARRVTYGLRTVDGVKQEPHRVHEEVVRAPVTQRVRVGTKELPRTAAGVDDLNWKALAACESGGRPNVVDRSGTYGGLYQFDLPTWRSVGGKGRPQDASEAEQTYRAKKLYMQRGASPWPHCGRRLTG